MILITPRARPPDPARRRGGRRPLSPLPRLEWLEDRTTPSTLIVGSAADSGPGSLRDAVAAAVADDVISFSPALFGQTITLGSRVVIDKSLTIDGPGAGLVSISGNSATGLLAVTGAPRVSIDGLTLTGGSDQTAGAIDNPAGSLFLRDCVFTSNHAASSAGAISSGGRLIIDGCTFSSNSAGTFIVSGSGGAILTTGEAVITTSLFSSNSALAAYGLPGGSTGGAIANSGSLSLFGCTFAANTVQDGKISGVSGGGLSNGGDASVTNCTFTGNVASGVFASASGGAIVNQGGSLLVRNSTIYANTARALTSIASGGGIANLSGTFTLLNSIVAGNTVTPDLYVRGAPGPDLFREVISLGNNLIQDPSGAGLFGDLASNVIGLDPRLGPLADNGGPTPTMALLSDSPALDRGHFTGTPPVDQRGFPRVVDGVMDIGAFESGFTGLVGITVAVGTGAGAAAVVNVYDRANVLVLSLQPFDQFAGGVTTAVGDVNGDASAEVIVGAGPGGAGGHVKVFDTLTGNVMMSFQAFPGFLGGVSVGAGDVNGDGADDVIVGAGPGAPGGHVKVFDGRTGGELMSFMAFEGFAGGVSVAGGDVNGDGRADVIVGAGAGASGGHVKVFDGRSGAELMSFMAFDGFAGGVSVGAGDVDGDGFAELIVGAGAGAPGGHVKVFDGRTDGAQRESFMSFPGFAGGVRVAGYDADGDGLADVAAATGPGAAGGHVQGFDGLTLAVIDSFFAFPGFAGGVFVGG